MVSLYNETYWERLASNYQLLESPLRPAFDDIRAFEDALADWTTAHPRDRARALLLGSTPDVALMRWPGNMELIGADQSLAMLRSVWPGDRAGKRSGICADWRRLPLPPSSVAVAIGDGSLNCVRHPEDAEAVCRSVRRVLSPEGLLALRCYVRPDEPETTGQVFEDLFQGAIPTFTQFRFRLFLAMPQDLRSGVVRAEMYRVWSSYSIDPVCLAGVTGWPLREIETIESLRDCPTAMTFPTLEEYRGLLHRYFEETRMITPPYALGEQCPIFLLRPRAGALA